MPASVWAAVSWRLMSLKPAARVWPALRTASRAAAESGCSDSACHALQYLDISDVMPVSPGSSITVSSVVIASARASHWPTSEAVER